MKIKKITLGLLVVVSALGACKKDKTVEPEVNSGTNLRATIDYSKITADTKYDNTNTLFVDASGKSTVDLTTGNTRFRMFQGINTYAGIWKTKLVDGNVLKNLYANSGSPFTVETNPAPVDFAALNASGLQLRNVTASSWAAADAEIVRKKIEADFASIATISASANVAASKGVAGYVSTTNAATGVVSKYLVDAKGLETGQLIQKGLIGALQIDYISNILLNGGLDADNKTVVTGKNYTKLEQNWDEAYGALTVNNNYLIGSTTTTRGTTEFALGSYLWEYGQVADDANFNYTKVLPAFLKGRAAIANNDKAELQKQALIIRTTIERSIARAAKGYLKKWNEAYVKNDMGAAAHAMGEGLGFIYSLRFCTLNKVDVKFSDDLINGLTGSSGGIWDFTITSAPMAAASATAAINAKFGL